jgi:hypothetical protein
MSLRPHRTSARLAELDRLVSEAFDRREDVLRRLEYA